MTLQITQNYKSINNQQLIAISKTSKYHGYLFLALGIIILLGSVVAIYCLYPEIGYRSLTFGAGILFGLGLIISGNFYNHKILPCFQKNISFVLLQKNNKLVEEEKVLESNLTKIENLSNNDSDNLNVQEISTQINTVEFPESLSENISPSESFLNSNRYTKIMNLATVAVQRFNTLISSSSKITVVDKAILNSQLNPLKQAERELQSSREKNKTVKLSENAYMDLIRTEVLILNGELIFDKNDFPLIEESMRATYLFNSLEQKFSSTVLAVHAIYLMEQNLKGEILKQIVKDKNLITDNGYATHAVSKKRSIDCITIDNENFKFLNEMLIKQTNLNDPDDIVFFKIKILITGSLESLDSKNVDLMTIESIYTKEYLTMQEACDDKYSFLDGESYF